METIIIAIITDLEIYSAKKQTRRHRKKGTQGAFTQSNM